MANRTAETILGALEVERMANGYYFTGVAATAAAVEAPDFGSIDAAAVAPVEMSFHQMPQATEAVA